MLRGAIVHVVEYVCVCDVGGWLFAGVKLVFAVKHDFQLVKENFIITFLLARFTHRRFIIHFNSEHVRVT